MLQFCGIVGFSSGGQEMGHHRTHVVLTLGHCAVLFRRMESDLLRTELCFSFGALRESVQTCGIWSPQDLLGFQLWDCVAFSSG